METQKKKRIVILGAGFGGVYAYLGLHKHLHGRNDIEIILIDKKNYFLFVPMIHEVATGNLEPSSVIQPIRQMITCCISDFVKGEVVKVDLDRKQIEIALHDATIRVVSFDYLVSALGSTGNFFGTEGAEKYSLPLKDLEDAQRARRRIVEAFERAHNASDQEIRETLLRFMVIGGGPTGVEFAGELADLIGNEMKKAYPDLHPLCELHLVHAAKRLMPPVDAWFAAKSTSILTKAEVIIHLETLVKYIDEKGVLLSTGKRIDSRTVFWTAGVKASDLDFTGEQAKSIKKDEKTGRVLVTPQLHIEGLDTVYVVGDQMHLGDMETGQPYPMRAQFAAREGYVAGENIARQINKKPLREFSWKDQGFIISLGKGGALAQAYGIKFSGPLAWWLYRTAYLFKLVGIRAKLKTAFEWTLNLFLPRDISKF